MYTRSIAAIRKWYAAEVAIAQIYNFRLDHNKMLSDKRH